MLAYVDLCCARLSSLQAFAEVFFYFDDNVITRFLEKKNKIFFVVFRRVVMDNEQVKAEKAEKLEIVFIKFSLFWPME